MSEVMEQQRQGDEANVMHRLRNMEEQLIETRGTLVWLVHIQSCDT
jgi:hypothetical protein